MHNNPVAALNGKTDNANSRVWLPYRGSDLNNPTQIDKDRAVTWQTITVPAGEQNNEAENPEYGNM
ncbi:pilus assembly protein PilX, partial [Pseudomonas aeruginosa]